MCEFIFKGNLWRKMKIEKILKLLSEARFSFFLPTKHDDFIASKMRNFVRFSFCFHHNPRQNQTKIASKPSHDNIINIRPNHFSENFGIEHNKFQLLPSTLTSQLNDNVLCNLRDYFFSFLFAILERELYAGQQQRVMRFAFYEHMAFHATFLATVKHLET